ncbi:dihydrodipicolinate synthase family protein [bacterium]|nr:MAG: dihydrodipicolinate synthase family protein [bacterium]
MTKKWEGIFPALTTKFKKDLSIDFSAMEKHVQFQLNAGVHGLVVMGSLGENMTLSQSEKLDVVKMTIAAAKGKVPVLSCVAETSTAKACEYAEQAANLGTDGFMVLPAIPYPSDRRETIAHYRAVAKATDRPIMIYNNPVAYKVDITPEMFVEMADEPRFVAIKESSDNIRRLTDIINLTGNRYQIFCGVDDLAMESLVLGANGWLAGLVCAFPRETVVLYELIKAGRIQEALPIYRWFMPLLHLDVSNKFVQNIKLVEQLVGVGSELVRPPRLTLIGEERAKVEQIVKAAMASSPVLPKV